MNGREKGVESGERRGPWGSPRRDGAEVIAALSARAQPTSRTRQGRGQGVAGAASRPCQGRGQGVMGAGRARRGRGQGTVGLQAGHSGTASRAR